MAKDIALPDDAMVVVGWVSVVLELLDLVCDVLPGKGEGVVQQLRETTQEAHIRIPGVNDGANHWVLQGFPIFSSYIAVPP